MIYLICSTIRPSMFIDTHNDWMSKVDDPSKIITKVVVDSIEDRQVLSDYDCLIYEGDTIGITKPLYKLTTSLIDLNDDDIIILLSDDFYPPEHWDTFIFEQFDGYTGGLLVCDGVTNLQRNQIVTIPMLDYKTLKLMNMVIYHPAYIHLYSDNELFVNLVQLNLLKNCTNRTDKIFKHLHWTYGERECDEHDKILSNNTIRESIEIYNHRMRLPLSQRLLVDDYNSKIESR